MAHLPEIPASAYTPEMDTLGVIPDIPVFEGDRVPVSRNALTPGTRPLQFFRYRVPISRFDTIPTRCAVSSLSCSLEEQFRDATVSHKTQFFGKLRGAAPQLRDAAAVA
ncbi:hypothetical protein JCGZ_03530 [Jatropha curcas]|uniref:Uncharacterized protein n=1 Tax=Jatropha curcas TaxID=180498 RepID=A0A067L0Q0_JATCU|nr:hypothetical protein JCGZ_03530 [Jatropha curcas]